MRRPLNMLAACAAAVLSACAGSTEPVLSYARQPVVGAYLYAGEPVNDIHLTWTTTLDASDTIPAPINDAKVSLKRRGVTYSLVKSPGDSGYYRYPGSDLVVAIGDVFDLEIIVGGQTITATTTVPRQPGSVTLSADTLKVQTPGPPTPGSPPQFVEQARVTVRWPATSGALYYVTVENLETTLTPIIDTTSFFRVGRGRLIFPPTAADSFTVNAQSLTYLGRHQVRVFRINEEYAQLYASRQQDSRDLNEPLSNIRGGLGVFSAFASDTARFVAVRP
ncbi:MAG: DUF4249 family protein [Gemmatimonadota bacterium]